MGIILILLKKLYNIMKDYKSIISQSFNQIRSMRKL
jgi:hypothetical protein